MREDEIYLLTKNWAIASKYQILGGQPPNGTDRFPVIEIKSEVNTAKGSHSSYKPDLVLATSSLIILVECKPQFDPKDVAKLKEISSSETRLFYLIKELRQRRSLERREHGLSKLSDKDLIKRIRYCVSYSGDYSPITDIYSLVFNTSGFKPDIFLGSIPIDKISD